jgi:hypothetical protein
MQLFPGFFTAAILLQRMRDVMLTNRNANTLCVTASGLPRRLVLDMVYEAAEHDWTKRMDAMADSQKLAVRAETGCKTSISRTSASIAIALALATTAAACSPIPCPSGYADPDWCKHYSGGDGSGG